MGWRSEGSQLVSNKDLKTLALCSVAFVYSVLLSPRWVPMLFDDTIVSEFSRDIIVSVLTLVLGIPIGLSINRKWQERQDFQSRVKVLKSIKETLKQNAHLLKSLVEHLQKNILSLPSFPMNLIVLDSTVVSRRALIDDINVLSSIDTAHYELMHLQRRMELMTRFAFKKEVPAPETLTIDMVEFCRKHDELKFIVTDAEKYGYFDTETIELLYLKISTIELAVGLPGNRPSTESSGGAVHHCYKAIERIDEFLKKHH